ncbi:hypothetical protein [uncultured Sulfitobacter sp.]|uniref:hypothetical protein n=1 Tax=uncultured Sulfitobacter sp. TaxID=191468 RepID=UPI002637FFA9|nr:hypothetical protein [uncultured Sulfitobacter sp.]
MRAAIFAFVALTTLPAVASAQSFRAVNDLSVVPLPGATFEVIEARGEGPRGIWCAAAEYAERRLGARDRIYVAAARGPARSVAGRKSVVFTTDASRLSQGPFQSTSLGTGQVGVGLPVAHAIQFCRRDDFETTDRILRRN